MATFGGAIRRGLPRRPGGEPWPEAGDAPAGIARADGAIDEAPVAAPEIADAVAAATADAAAKPEAAPSAVAPAAPSGETPALRQGLPRTPGGEPWPSATARAVASPGAAPSASPSAAARAVPGAAIADAPPAATAGGVPAEPSTSQAAAPAVPAAESEAVMRRGLPRVSGGEGWPPQGTVPATTAGVPQTAAAPLAQPAPEEPLAASAVPAPTPSAPAAPSPASAPAAPIERRPLSVPATVWPGRAAFHRPRPKPEAARLGPLTRGQWLGVVIVGGGALLFAAAMAVLLVRVVLSLPAMQDFLHTYPGEYHLPEGAPVGIPAWLGWQHFFNAFFMVLIIRTGLQIRREKRPAVFWTPRGNKKGKTSLTIWFHQALDVLWLVNGAVFVVLLFATGQWMRIVPTSWEVFPNAVSAALQYVSLDWPTENGWVNYNSLQQLAYFSTVFVAAPLAALSGFRMGGLWPRKNARLSAAYPIEWARRIHFPVMLFFVVFIFVHVALVFATGALRNLNHMYAAQGSVDGVAYADNWTGFWMFFASLVVIAAAWVAARPIVIAPVARLFGDVSGR